MSFGYYSLNGLNQIISSSSSTGAAITVSGVEPVFVTQSGNDFEVSLYENPANVINFAAFDKSLAVISLDAHVDVQAPLFTGAAASFYDLRAHSATGDNLSFYNIEGHSFTGPNASFYNLRAHSATGDNSNFFNVQGHSFSGPFGHIGQMRFDSLTGPTATIGTLTAESAYIANLFTDNYSPIDVSWQIATGAVSHLDLVYNNTVYVATGAEVQTISSVDGYGLIGNPYRIVNENTSTFSVKNTDDNTYPLVIVGDVINTFDLEPDSDSTYEIGDFGNRYLSVYSDNFVGDNAYLGNYLEFSSATGGNVSLTGYIDAKNVIATETLAGPLVSCETGFFQNMYTTTGTFADSAAWGDWRIVNNSPLMRISNINNSEPTVEYVSAFPNSYVVQATTVPIRTTATLGNISAPWAEVHTKRSAVNTIQFQGSLTGAPAYIKSKYIDIEIPTPSGTISLAGNNIESDYISATGSFSLFSTTELSTTLVGTASDFYTDTLQGFNRNITFTTGAASGTGAILSITGSNLGGKISLTVGTNPAQWSSICTVNFTKAWPNEPAVCLTPGNQLTAKLLGDSSVFVTSDTTSFSIFDGTTPLREGMEYRWMYQCVS